MRDLAMQAAPRIGTLATVGFHLCAAAPSSGVPAGRFFCRPIFSSYDMLIRKEREQPKSQATDVLHRINQLPKPESLRSKNLFQRIKMLGRLIGGDVSHIVVDIRGHIVTDIYIIGRPVSVVGICPWQAGSR